MIAPRAEEAAPDSIEATAALLGHVFPKAPHLDRARLAWDYLENPLGRSLLARTVADARLVATLAGRALHASLGGVATKGILIHHAATHPEFRRRGLLARSIEALVERARAGGAGFAIAVVNQQSVRTFVGAGGFAALGPLSVRLALGSLGLGDPADRAPLDFAPLRDPAWLAWRFAAPGSRYTARRRGARAEIWGDSGSAGIPVLLGDAPLDLLGAPPPAFASRAPLRLWVGRDASRRLEAPLSLELPLVLRPSPLHLVFRALSRDAPAPAPDRVHFDALDFDAW